jgi:hypothetical protein
MGASYPKHSSLSGRGTFSLFGRSDDGEIQTAMVISLKMYQNETSPYSCCDACLALINAFFHLSVAHKHDPKTSKLRSRTRMRHSNPLQAHSTDFPGLWLKNDER